MSNGVIKFSGTIHQHSVWQLVTFLKLMALQDITDIDIFISSTGGNTAASLNAYNELRAFDKILNLTTYCSGTCQSATFTMFLGVDNRKATSNCTFMFHQGKVTFNNKVTESEIEGELESIRFSNKQIVNIILDRTNINEVEEKFYKTYFFNEDDSLSMNVINEVVPELPEGHDCFVTIHGFDDGNVNYQQQGLL
jgi:ATP-dependent protease ClpP protease subunit